MSGHTDGRTHGRTHGQELKSLYMAGPSWVRPKKNVNIVCIMLQYFVVTSSALQICAVHIFLTLNCPVQFSVCCWAYGVFISSRIWLLLLILNYDVSHPGLSTTLVCSSAVQCSAVQCSAVQCIAVQCSAVQCSAVQCSAVQRSAVQ